MIRVLYVEDDADIRMVTEIALEDEGFELSVCESGVVAVARAGEIEVDLILMDVMMPELNGPDTIRQLRSHANLSATPVIFMTAKTQNEDQYQGPGVIGVIFKPFNPMTLAEDIRSLLENGLE